MAEQELQIEDSAKKGKLIIIVAAVIVIASGIGGYLWLSGSSDSSATQQLADAKGTSRPTTSTRGGKAGTALYVAMPRPFVFNVPGTGRDRLVQIKVQLMVRGSDNEETAKSHIPLIEGTLLHVFSASNADDLVTEAGKIALREKALGEVQQVLKNIVGVEVVEQVLFTGFVMQ
ncbi:flagellar basal body-associated protein FliL [Alteromonas aestuariivivens]|uniref:Flagellar protein FliL n=1 Tax=Alteromonas aestuariivivens TaxID=1938339 RepID=A0A3D8M6B6_9ALTE|nr:flagellar basal body-associated protein FliL [Alteromonas aestuariivivens]RDV25074.1 flagellar basal body-associated protein FliL [Alteromonas aestuariivivens]